MAEVLGMSAVFSPCGQRSVALSCQKRSPSFAGFPLSSFRPIGPLRYSSQNNGFYGGRFVIGTRRGKLVKGNASSSRVQMSLCLGKSLKWWEKGLQPNMKEIESAQDLVDSLLDGGDKLVVVDFFSPGCGGCKALHPKICQFAEMNPDVIFLQVNYEKHKSMCYSLHVHVLPFFRFYRGAHGRLCSFSCTNATIKKFKDALAKHTTERCSLGPTKGLEESELVALAANKDLSFNYTRKPVPALTPDEAAEKVPVSPKLSVSSASRVTQDSEDKALVAAGR
ncbi:thioredoxin-like 1-2, chloroplastic [Phoenix dactylifera]|uniref:Thioredoxin-like 1-2, chloroplastic n=1 Tax=Phoenix dactylifera TaxID=42345 RepID=A0A8B7BPN0_PHODC|nr:thioredoxin-like 1-2, chloroplastic [Phoenix dactylifera]